MKRHINKHSSLFGAVLKFIFPATSILKISASTILLATLLMSPLRGMSASHELKTLNSRSVVKTDQDVTVLEPGKKIEREIAGGQEHVYQIKLAAKQYARVIAEQKGVNLVLMLFDPEGKQQIETDLTANFGQESLSKSVVVGGLYQLKVRPSKATALAGAYRLQIEIRPTATAADVQRAEAEQLLNDAKPLANKGGAETQQAAEKFQKALSLWRQLQDRYWEAQTLRSLGRAHGRLNQYEKAYELYKQALAVNVEIKNKAGESDAHNDIGTTFYYVGQYEQAVNHFQRMLAGKREIKDRENEGGALLNLGAVYNTWGYQDKSVEHYEQALKIMREVKNRNSEGFVLSGLGNVHLARSEFQKALDSHQQSLVIYREIKDRTTEGLTLGNIGKVYNAMGRYDEAMKFFDQALAIARETKDYRTENNALNGLAYANFSMSRYEKALQIYEETLNRNRAIKNRAGERNSLNDLGMIYSSLGQYDKAVEHFEHAAAISREIKDKFSEASAFNNLGIVYNYLGREEKAIEYLASALAIYQEFKDRDSQASAHNNIGMAYTNLGQIPKAIEHYEKSLQVIRDLKKRTDEAPILSNIGNAYYNLKRYDKAGEFQAQALAISREMKNRVVEGRTLDSIAKTKSALGQHDQAMQNFEQALAILREVGDVNSEAGTLFGMAEAARAQNNLPQARNLIEQSLQINDKLRSNMYSQESRAAYFAGTQKFNKFYIDLLMQMHRAEPTKGFDSLAFEASERARARGLLELLSEPGARIRQGVDAALIEREETLARQINAKAAEQMTLIGQSPSSEKVAQLKREIGQLENDYERVQAEIRRSSPRYAALTQPQPLSVKEIQNQILDPETVLLEYSLGDKRSFVWAISPTSFKSFELPSREKVESQARRVYELLTARTAAANDNETAAQKSQRVQKSDAELQLAATELSQMILSPVANETRAKRLAIVADGALQYIPFAMLSAPRTKPARAAGKAVVQTRYQPLVMNHEIVTLPSASTLAIQRRELSNRQPAPQTLAVIADPVFQPTDERVKITVKPAGANIAPAINAASDTRKLVHETTSKLSIARLPFTRQEADQILSAVPAVESFRAIDFRANRDTVLNGDLGKYQYLHFATHGYLDTERPGLSALVLSLVDEQGKPQDGFLRAHEVYNLKLPAELVVLSACQTGLGKEIKGEGLVGLTRGFMYAGAKRVVVSLWSVSDKATADLMQKFYGNMLKNSERPAAALRTAQVEMWKQKGWQSPYFWSAFVIQGDWK